ncbi:MAG: hypothetical protein AB7D36_02560 [Oscillospiraceae bacterium]
MSLEAIKNISEAEEQARQIKAEATSEAKRMISEAYTTGKAAVAAAEKKAGDELCELAKKADEKAMAGAKELAANSENRKAAMRSHAEARMDKAVSLIVERIVNS